MENDEDVYTPVEPNIYNYTALNRLVENVDDILCSNIKIKITAYEIKNNKKNPYLLYLLYKDELSEALFFPELPTMYPNVNSDNVIIAPDPKGYKGVYKYTTQNSNELKNWEMLYNPTTGEISHLAPTRD